MARAPYPDPLYRSSPALFVRDAVFIHTGLEVIVDDRLPVDVLARLESHNGLFRVQKGMHFDRFHDTMGRGVITHLFGDGLYPDIATKRLIDLRCGC